MDQVQWGRCERVRFAGSARGTGIVSGSWLAHARLVTAALAIAFGLIVEGCGDDEEGAAVVTQRQISVPNEEARIVAEVFDTGRSSGTVVMLPSFARGAGDFTDEFGSDLAQRVAVAGYQVVLPWPRDFGEGLSTGSLEGLTLEVLASDVAAVIREVSDGPVAMLGHAYGQRVARMLATTHPDLVDRLILVAAGGAEATPAEATAAIVTLVLDPSATREERIAALEVAFFAPGNDPTVWLDGWGDLALGIAQTNANPREAVPTWYAAGGIVPMFVVQAEFDATAPAEDSSAILLRDFPDRVEVATVTNAGHAMLPEQPEQVAAAVLDFLSR